ncbi:tetratricopeptide repeat protein [Thalassobaculum sp. OXR-137]|uniref:tetratricopeptide repeat protein n=1 Tax=Thalassobaculum sp. OXR-137 TaxID=3100173 RepID=UPI002AC8AFB4|nr:tetratricopeptide repeat protein [Thalassobaculum sp. OXR-137]WPZ35456.1 tetratricopeptide repeat protein [Thalassobaculum sp. OXR-137]
MAGAFLAGRYADRIRDVGNASTFMDRVVESGDIGIALKRRAFLLRLEAGRYDDAAVLAPEIVDTLDANAPIANIFMAVEAARVGDFDRAARLIDSLPDNRLNRVLSPLLDGWIALGQGNRETAEQAIDGVLEIDGFAVLHALHSAMLADAAGETALAAERYEAALANLQDPPLRVRLVAANFQARFESVEAAMATAIVTDATAADPSDVEAYLRRVAETRKGLHPSAADGLAQAFFDLGSALQRDRRSELGMVFSRLALRLDPDFDLATLLIAEILDDRQQYGEALALYDTVPETSAYRLMAELRAVSSLVDMDRMDEAVDRLNALADRRPEQIDPLVRLGDLYRSTEEWKGAISAYNRAFSRLPAGDPGSWSMYYSRGIALERDEQWERAEADFLTALELRPEQPYVLNYLGYTWIDQGRNLSRATQMIEQAVALRPNDGYIVDSLGWAMYRQERFAEAVEHLERAVELLPTDATINDHLGDAYWRVGRRQEARFQWQRALSFDPDADLAKSIEHKLQAGLPAVQSGSVKTADTKADVDG